MCTVYQNILFTAVTLCEAIMDRTDNEPRGTHPWVYRLNIRHLDDIINA